MYCVYSKNTLFQSSRHIWPAGSCHDTIQNDFTRHDPIFLFSAAHCVLQEVAGATITFSKQGRSRYSASGPGNGSCASSLSEILCSMRAIQSGSPDRPMGAFSAKLELGIELFDCCFWLSLRLACVFIVQVFFFHKNGFTCRNKSIMLLLSLPYLRRIQGVGVKEY